MLDRRSAHAERAMDDLRKKFGNAAVIRGIAYDGPEKAAEKRLAQRSSRPMRSEPRAIHRLALARQDVVPEHLRSALARFASL